VGSVKGSIVGSVEGSDQDWSPIEGSVALADSLGVVSGFGVDRDVGGPVRVALRGRLALATGLS
jgi:hypothetical protein